MAGKSNNPEVPAEPWYVVKKRQLESDLRLWDDALASLLDAIGEARRESGLTIQMFQPTSALGSKMRALQNGLTVLASWRNAVLSELAAL